MIRSYRGIGLVLLMVLVVAPLTLFAVLALFEEESADSIKLSLDGVHWTSSVDGALLASETPWTPGEVRSAIVYVKNGNQVPVDADVTVLCRSTEVQVEAAHLTLATQADPVSAVPFPVGASPRKVQIDELPAGSTVPVTVTGTFAHTAPAGSTIDGSTLLLELEIRGARSESAGPPSLLDAAGAQLWLAPILLVGGAIVVLRAQARRHAAQAQEQTQTRAPTSDS